jgi:hypothetical protein
MRLPSSLSPRACCAALLCSLLCSLLGTASAQTPAPAPLLGALPSDAGVTVQLVTDGCMKRDHLTASPAGSDTAQVSVNTPGVCDDRWPLGQRFLLTWADLGTSDSGLLANPLAPIHIAQPAKAASLATKPAAGTDQPIFGYLIDPDALVVSVDSGGCTTLDQFQPWIEPTDPPTIHLTRTIDDQCEADLPWGQTLRFTWEQLGVTASSARLANPVLILR